MHTRVVAALSVVAVLLTFAQSWAQQAVRIEGSSYVEESAKWYVLDSRGERWEVQPGYRRNQVPFRNNCAAEGGGQGERRANASHAASGTARLRSAQV